MSTHAEAQTSGLPFPPLLRKEIFDKRGLPEWYCPAGRPRLLAPALFVAGSTLAMASLLLAVTQLTHSRQHRLVIEMQESSLRCGSASAHCSAVFLLRSGMRGTRMPDVDGRPGLVLTAENASSPVRVVASFSSTSVRQATLRIAWPQAKGLPSGELTLLVDETRPLIAWIAPKLFAQKSAERTP